MSNEAAPITTSSPRRQMKLRAKTSGCSVCTNTPTRHSGSPAATIRSQVSWIIALGPTADRAPSISQSLMALSSGDSIKVS